MRRFYSMVLLEIVPWNFVYVNLSHLIFLGNSLDFIWCFNFCTSLWSCTSAPNMFEGKTSVLLIIPALEINCTLLSLSQCPHEYHGVCFGYGSQHTPFKYVSLENGSLAISYIISFLQEEGEQDSFLWTHSGDRRPFQETAP